MRHQRIGRQTADETWLMLLGPTSVDPPFVITGMSLEAAVSVVTDAFRKITLTPRMIEGYEELSD